MSRTFFYDCCLVLISLCMLPKLLYMRLFHKKYKNSLAHRFGAEFPTIDKKGKRLIWIHAVSVGEARAVSPLAQKIRTAEPDAIILISSITETGHAEAKRAIPFADYHVFLPFDFSWTIRSVLKKAKPDLVIFCESDFWYNFLNQAKQLGAKIVLVNGKISEKSFKRFHFFKKFAKALFSLFDQLCVQNETYKERFLQLGAKESKLHVTGNMKFDDVGAQIAGNELDMWKHKLGLKEDDRVLAIGSTHDPEEKMLTSILQNLLKDYSNLKILLVPRHPERFNAVADVLRNQQIDFSRYSEAGPSTERVLLIDAMGVLRRCYQIASLAIVGGSFCTQVGGHNILEPLWYGVPVIYGPHMFSQADLVELVQSAQAGEQVSSEELEGIIRRFLNDNQFKTQVIGKGKGLVGTIQGSTDRTWKIIQDGT